jgi:hypothetical protein
VSETNSQVTGRTNPRLIDLIAALATGTVGAFALVRSDVSDTLPGVAIAISLVPPLAVVALALEAGRYDEALGALLLFGTNVTAIIATGTVVLLLYRVRDVAKTTGAQVGVLRGHTLEVRDGTIRLVAIGPPPEVDPETLRAELDLAGLDLDLVISLVVGGQRELPAERSAGPG